MGSVLVARSCVPADKWRGVVKTTPMWHWTSGQTGKLQNPACESLHKPDNTARSNSRPRLRKATVKAPSGVIADVALIR